LNFYVINKGQNRLITKERKQKDKIFCTIRQEWFFHLSSPATRDEDGEEELIFFDYRAAAKAKRTSFSFLSFADARLDEEEDLSSSPIEVEMNL